MKPSWIELKAQKSDPHGNLSVLPGNGCHQVKWRYPRHNRGYGISR
jgi:hypothetical protein